MSVCTILLILVISCQQKGSRSGDATSEVPLEIAAVKGESAGHSLELLASGGVLGNGTPVGTVAADGSFRNRTGKIVCQLHPDGRLEVPGEPDETWTIDRNGNIRDKSGALVVEVKSDGSIALGGASGPGFRLAGPATGRRAWSLALMCAMK
jgi:hypothetical protein